MELKKIKKYIGITLGIIIVLAFAMLLCTWHAGNTIRKSHVVTGKNVRIEFDGITLSSNHIIHINYNLIGHSELSKAMWRLKPFNEVSFQK